MTKKKVQPTAPAGKASGGELTWKDISDRNPLTVDEVNELMRSLALRLDIRDVRDFLLVLHAFTFELSRGQRENMLQTAKEATAWIFPAFDTVVRDEICAGLQALREGGAR